MPSNLDSIPIDELDNFWLPFTANRQFKKNPRLLVSARDMHYRSNDGREILDGTSGLWCCNAGHCRPGIVEAIRRQAGELDFAPTFQMGHPLPFELAARLARIAPPGLNRVFFSNSGSEAVDTALKIALAYRWAKNQPDCTGLVGREKAYHGVNFGGISVGGIDNNRKQFGSRLSNIDHLPHTLDIERNSFTRGLPEHGLEKADALETIIKQRGAGRISAVIVEPISCSAGVILPPAGYLKRLREICDCHDILLIFDEVITGFGRVGHAFAAIEFDVRPDIIVSAKGLTNGTVPMGVTMVNDKIHETLMNGPENIIELFHGYTYSGHPLACVAGLASLDVYEQENLFQRAIDLGPFWQEQAHALGELAHVKDVRNYGLMAGIELHSRPDSLGARAYEVFTDCFHRHDLLVRATADTIALSPPLIINRAGIEDIFARLAEAIRHVK